ncbi:MAG: carboxypeptidase regulatory-like domain-containing protein [Terracidiphilus sp.]
MLHHRGAMLRILPVLAMVLAAFSASAQSGSAGVVRGTVADPSGAVIPGATVDLTHATSGYNRTAATDATGQFSFTNVPFDPYRIQVTAKGFAPLSEVISIDSAVGTDLKLVLQVAGASQTVTVESSGQMVEDTSTYHTDVDRDLFTKVPLESQSSSLSALVTETAPGVSADSNGLFHGLGDHASNSFSIDGQPITDQQSKVFSNQLPTNAVQSMEVIEGAPPAQYGDKTSLVIVATTRSGQGVTEPTGSVYGSYGSFGSGAGGFNLSYGGSSWGNFIEMDGLDTGRFLDPPEFTFFHAKGNEENVFDRIDYSFTQADSVHLDMNYSRSWFQTPNSYDNLNVLNVVNGSGASASPTFGVVGNTDQRSKIGTFNVAPTYTRIISNDSVLNFSVYTRRDNYNYYPSGNPLQDLGPANLQTSSISQFRTLTNAGSHIDFTYARGRQNLLAGAQYEQSFLREHDSLGVVENTYNSPCVDMNGNPLPGYASPSGCGGVTSLPNGSYLPVLAPYDLTRGGTNYLYFGHTDVKELALYIEDQIKAGNWNFNLGIRGDVYNGLTTASQAEPRLGVAYRVKPTTTVLSISYARTLETPFNENLVLSSSGCSNAVLAPLLQCSSGVSGTMQPGYRNEFHASVQQAFGKYLVLSGEYIWKYTHNSFDFSVLGNTPIAFPIDWHNSKIPGYALHAAVPNLRGFSAYMDASSVAARFFPPQVAGAGATVGQSGYPFRIDHDEKFNQTTHVQYTVSRDGHWVNGLWGGFNWRLDSGQVAGSVPCYGVTGPNSLCGPYSITLPGNVQGVDLSGLTPDEQFEAGITCDGVTATPTSSFTSCDAAGYTSKLVRIPAPGTEDDDHNPPRIAPRSLFDVTLGKNNIFHKERFKTDLDLTAINLTNKYALYNFLSTFSGTHYVTPRAMTAKITLNF